MKILAILAVIFALYAGTVNAVAPVPSCIPNISSGTAPLYVHLDCTGTIDADTSFPYHRLDYKHNFGDSGAGKWLNGTNTALSKNQATGPIAAHIYETAGNYSITSRVCDDTICKNVSNAIVVAAADTTWSTNTICIANGSLPVQGVGGCPSGSTVRQGTGDFDADMTVARGVNGCGTSIICKRILFKRGDSFVASDTSVIFAAGPGLIGAYGSGNKPHITGTGTPDSYIQFSNGTTYSGVTDWRVIDLDMVAASGQYVSAIKFQGTASRVTILRVDMSGFGIGISADDNTLDNYNNNQGGSHVIWSQLAVVDCTWISPFSSNAYPIFMAAEKDAIMGNNFNNANALTGGLQGAHVIRRPYFGKSVIANNTLASPTGSQGNEVSKFHGPAWRTFTGTTHTSTTIDGIWSTTGYSTGETISGVGIPVGTKIATIASATSITIDQAATASATITLTLANSVDTAGIGGGYSRWLIVADNKFVGDTAIFGVAIQPRNFSIDERIKDVIVERNWFTSGPPQQFGLIITAQEITVRNNIFNMSGSTTHGTAILVYQPGTTANQNSLIPQNIWISHNTDYQSNAIGLGETEMVRLGAAGATVLPNNIIINSNLMYAPAENTPKFLNDFGATNLTVGNNSTDDNAKNQNPIFDSVSTYIGFRLSASSPVKNSGTNDFPSTVNDGVNCKSKLVNVRYGAFVPRTEALCNTVAGP